MNPTRSHPDAYLGTFKSFMVKCDNVLDASHYRETVFTFRSYAGLMFLLIFHIASKHYTVYPAAQHQLFEVRPNPGRWPSDHGVGQPSWHDPPFEAIPP